MKLDHLPHTVKKTFRLFSLLIFALTLTPSLVLADQYVFYYNGNFMANNNGSIANTTTFNPSTCVWEGTSGGKFSNSGQYIKFDYQLFASSIISLVANSNQASNLTVNGNTLFLGSSLLGFTSYYLHFDNNNWRATSSSQDVVYKLSSSFIPATSQVSHSISNLSIEVSKNELYPGEVSDSWSTPAQATKITTTVPAHTRYTLTPASGTGTSITLYHYNNSTYSSLEELPKQTSSQLLDATVFTYHWELSPQGPLQFLYGEQTEDPNNRVAYQNIVNTDQVITAKLTARCSLEGQPYQHTTSVDITAKGMVLAQSVTLEDMEMRIGEQRELTFQLNPSDSYRDNIAFTTAPTGIVSVSPTGQVTANQAGTTTLTIVVSDPMNNECCRASCQMKVVPNPTSLSAQNRVIGVGSVVDLGVSLQPSNAYKRLSYSSDNPQIADVNTEGIVTGLRQGAATITIRAYDIHGLELCSTSCLIEVSATIEGVPIESVSDLESIRLNPAGVFTVITSFDASSFTSSIDNFTGTFNGNFCVITGLTKPLFDEVNGATIKNVVLDNVQIEGETSNVGGIVNTAKGDTRIYNCGIRATSRSSVSGGSSTGGIVGRIADNTRVINCYSYAEVSSGYTAGGIVGYNAYASTSSDLRTMVMNCLFYGDITSGTAISPIYGGRKITNNGNTGLNNYNYYRYLADYSVNGLITDYNCALAAEERYLNRYEFYRGLLNSNKDLCSWYIAGDFSLHDDIAKWVLDTDIAPYPILKPQGHYPSRVNRFVTEAFSTAQPRQGGLLTDEGNAGYLTVTVSRGAYGSGSASTTMSLPITDMDYNSYDYTYAKVVLPFYNQYFDGNYTNNKVVTGWKITSISGGTGGQFTTTGLDRYNFADRNCTQKDIYDVSGRVFAQGGYFCIPKGVTAITIEAYWGDAVYLSDATYDVVYRGNDYSITNSANCFGTRYNNGDSYNINGSSQQVYTSLTNAMNQLQEKNSVYDQAIVLVGNYHSYTAATADAWFKSINMPFTIMSADFDRDNEADFCIIHQHSDRIRVNPIRFDQVWHPGIGMAHKLDGTTQMPNQGIFAPMGWFEITETALARYTEFEYDLSSKNGGRVDAPLILNSGIFEQFVSTLTTSNVQNTIYMILGGNLLMKQFAPGTHADGNGSTKHNPVNVIGGSFNEFYLSGMFKPGAAVFDDGDVMCYINGGKFGVVAGAGQEQINGNVWWKIDNAVIEEFYGGGINKLKPITGNINTIINNSYVTKFCGGPKFGSMQTGKIVTTTADQSHFGTFYGAGNGGTSLYRQRTKNASGEPSYSWATWVNDYNRLAYSANGIAVQPEYEFFAWAGGSSTANVGRFYINHASFDKAETNNVSSTLTNCTIDHDFYGGGNLGNVKGTATSILESCVVHGSVFGGGFSAQIPTVMVYPSGWVVEPAYDGNAGIYKQGQFNEPVPYTWSRKQGLSQTNNHDDSDHTIWSNESLEGLGQVQGDAVLTIKGNTLVAGSVFGGGNESGVGGNTTVTLENGQVTGAIYGGGNQAGVQGTANLTISGGVASRAFGGGNLADVGGAVSLTMTGGEITEALYGGGALANTNTASGTTRVSLQGGMVGDVFGGGLGSTEVAAQVNGNISLTVNGARVQGEVFGCNNLNGTPLKSVQVDILTSVARNNNPDDYHILAVYGGGNKAAYLPTDANNVKLSVNVWGCDNSIQQVYGGGNAASTPCTSVYIEGGRFDYVFGGGNGSGNGNPGANVGYYTDIDNMGTPGARYGTGRAEVLIKGGYINHLFGGSNKKGNIREASTTVVEGSESICPLEIGEAYAAGNEAYMDGIATLDLGCIDYLEELYGGAKNTDIHSDIEMNITSGSYGKIFGGNNLGGNIYGSITINVEETGCRPIEIGSLFAGGNRAPYSTPTGKAHPLIRVRSCTSIGTIYGGGYGETAIMSANPTISLQLVKGLYAEQIGNSIGSIGSVFGGGDAAHLIGNTTLLIATEADADALITGDVFGGGNQANVEGSSRIEVANGHLQGNLFGGGKQGNIHSTSLHLRGNCVVDQNVYGGGFEGDVRDTTSIVVDE